MKIIRGKKGAELSVNVIIIAILAILVLVIVAFIFSGGASKISSTIKDLFTGSTSDDLAGARIDCNSLCLEAKGLSDPVNQKESQFCTKKFDKLKGYEGTELGCDSDQLNVQCDNVECS